MLNRNVRHDVYALALHTTCSDSRDPFPPRVSLALVEEREAFLRLRGPRAPEFIWSPYEWATEVWLSPSSSDADLFGAANAYIHESGTHARAYALMRNVARRGLVKRPDLHELGSPICFFVLYDLANYPAQLVAQVSKETASDLRRKGWL